ncbi:hypothetical protein M378DRAFT_161690 [Amanita muscaria Koide BX008]|uniref:Uncharacterized protein n=1 Tax=Amanita muscaria (strain Koide BX008) TaxID=946122 RepID=A0A0C2X8R6_AMAMK|nr:hypothetical protein M378DRAFT_161690 [Amanita muscaria Koide BX008]
MWSDSSTSSDCTNVSLVATNCSPWYYTSIIRPRRKIESKELDQKWIVKGERKDQPLMYMMVAKDWF